MKRLLTATFVLLLSGCFDAEVTVDFQDDTTMLVAYELRMDRALYDMTGGNTDESFCGDASEVVVGEAQAICSGEETRMIADVLSAQGSTAPSSSNYGVFSEPPFSLVQESSVQYRVTFDIEQMFAQSQTEMAQDDIPEGMEDMARAALAGRSFVLRVRAHEVIETNGVVSDDRKEATHYIPMTILLEDSPDFGPAFTTVLRTAPSCRLFGMICN